jgi:transcriptional regulator with XRE-family HTH domain
MTSLSSEAVLPGFGFARARDKAFAAIRELWKIRRSEGVSQTDIATRLGRDPAWVSRKLSGPSNWTLRTFGELADALDGEVDIRVLDIKNAVNHSNYDAYSGYGENPEQRAIWGADGESQRTSNPLPKAA